jgi:hypothetical protein
VAARGDLAAAEGDEAEIEAHRLRTIHNYLEADMTAQEFLALSTKLFNDMKAWVAEASKVDTLVPSDLAMLEASMKIIERVTLKEVETKPNTAN